MASLLGIECGATSSTALLVCPSDDTSKLFKFGPANYMLVTLHELEAKLLNLKQDIMKNHSSQLSLLKRVGIALPGIFDADKPIVEEMIKRIWPDLEMIWVGNDLETAMASLQAPDDCDEKKQDKMYDIHCILISGTGSCAYGINGSTTAKIGGHGHVIGDLGSGYAIALQGLKESLKEHERTDGNSTLFDNFKKSLNVPTSLELVRWSLLANKTELASLAPIVLNAWKDGNRLAKNVIDEAIENLAFDLTCLVKKLIKSSSKKIMSEISVKVGLTGSLLVENVQFQCAVSKKIESILSLDKIKVDFKILQNTVQGALIMISKLNSTSNGAINNNNPVSLKKIHSNELAELELNEESLYQKLLPIPTSLSPTECRNPASLHLDSMSIEEAIDLWLAEESSWYEKIGQEKGLLKKLIIQVTNTLRNGGRLFYIGSGTSGRLGILDASECPPTFSTPPHMVQGITAGGKAAVFSSVEGAEDSILGGMRVIDEYGITSKDLVMGIACSGRTPFVWGSLYRAKSLGAFTAFLTFNPNMTLQHTPDIVLSFNIGPEILTGSTRLKSGSATKCILNMITTLTMVQLGKCLENLMVDVNPCNRKLKERALRIVMAILNRSSSCQAQDESDEVGVGKYKKDAVYKVLLANNYDIKKTVQQLRRVEENDDENVDLKLQ